MWNFSHCVTLDFWLQECLKLHVWKSMRVDSACNFSINRVTLPLQSIWPWLSLSAVQSSSWFFSLIFAHASERTSEEIRAHSLSVSLFYTNAHTRTLTPKPHRRRTSMAFRNNERKKCGVCKRDAFENNYAISCHVLQLRGCTQKYIEIKLQIILTIKGIRL